jgi:NAD(P)-dependent dehydrogenase (short-subunit alcohol dehydrogenase family)
VVTGSTKGIGRAIGMRLAREGFNVVLNYASDDGQADAALSACREVTPHVIVKKADVSQRGDVEELMTAAVDQFGSLDVLVNNAARVADGPALTMTDDDWERVINTNMRGTFVCSQVAARHMIDQVDGGVILNIGAATGLRARKNGINTCASKAGIMIMTQCLALELAPKVRVNSIIPGLTMTDEVVQRFNLTDPTVRQSRLDTIPLKRIGTPEDVADAVMLLLSPQAQFVTGQKLHIDGGQYMF